jgi:hypothetical protein
MRHGNKPDPTLLLLKCHREAIIIVIKLQQSARNPSFKNLENIGSEILFFCENMDA